MIFEKDGKIWDDNTETGEPEEIAGVNIMDAGDNVIASHPAKNFRLLEQLYEKQLREGKVTMIGVNYTA